MRSPAYAAAFLLLLGASGVQPAQAQLLGGLLGSGNDGGLVGLTGGTAGGDSTVNVGVGSDSSSPNNVLDVNLGGRDAADLDLRTTRGVGARLTLFGGASAGGVTGSVNALGGGNSLASANITIGRPGQRSAVQQASAATAEDVAVDVEEETNGQAQLLADVSCDAEAGRKVLAAASGDFSARAAAGWQRASNVNIVPVEMCAETRRELAQILRRTTRIDLLQDAAARDGLIAASLARTRYDFGDVYAVDARGNQLTVYVY